jgi:multicomponent Na+:H+ antiporter subunit E
MKHFLSPARLLGFARFATFYAWELVVSSVRVAHDVLTPTFHMRPAIVRVPLEPASDLELLATANLVSLTPGTLSLDITPDRRTLIVHVMYADADRQATRQAIKREIEQPVLRLFRR